MEQGVQKSDERKQIFTWIPQTFQYHHFPPLPWREATGNFSNLPLPINISGLVSRVYSQRKKERERERERGVRGKLVGVETGVSQLRNSDV